MSFKLKRVELSNMRSHKHFIFEPEESGVTALRGTNGAGKSTIVDSIAWALYGTKPSGVSKVSALYRDGAEFGKDKCFVVVDFEIEGYSLRVERRMISKGGAVEADVWEISKDENGEEKLEHKAGSAVTHVKSYITRRLNMDEKGFLAAILVQQKEVDKLISAAPAERARVIEKLTGISAITAALEEAIKEHNSLKRVASLSTIDEDSLTKLQEEKEKLSKKIEDQKKSLKKLSEQGVEAKDKANNLKNELEEASEKFYELESLREENTINEVRLESLESDFNRVNDERNAKKKQLSLLASGVSIEDIEPKVDSLKANLRNKEIDVSRIKSNIDRISNEKKSFEQTLEELSDLSEKTKVSELQDNVDSENDTKNRLSEDNISMDSEKKKINKAIKILTKEDGCCPTCLQEVKDVSSAVSSLEKEIKLLETKQDANKTTIDELKKSISHNEDLIVKLNQKSKAIQDLEFSANHLQELNKELVVESAEIDTLSNELKSLENIYSEAKYHQRTREEYDRLLDQSKKISSNIESLSRKISKSKNKLSELGSVTRNQLESLRKKNEKAQTKSSELRMKFTEEKGEIKVNTEKLNNIDLNISRGEEEVKKYKDLLKSVEVAATSRQLIEKFREERIENSIPVIEAYASDLMSRFTQGAFNKLKLDSKFNATVMLANGSERSVSLLSGGELSAASMALRLAISMLLNSGSSSNLIILDEVLVSQDVVRAEQMLTTVKEVCKGQVILIAHNDHIDSIADNVIQLSAS